MDEEYDSQSWQDRCERYFTSISDTGKDKDQEKHDRNDSENSREKRESGNVDDNDEIWKDLSEVRKRFSEHRFVRRARKWLSVLDIYGTKFASKSKGTANFVLGLTVVLIAVVVFVVLLYFLTKEYRNESSEYRIKNIESSKMVADGVSLTLCNLNLIKKSKLARSDLNNLKNLLDLNGTNAHIQVDQTERRTVQELVDSNSRLKILLQNMVSNSYSDLISNFENDVVVQELMATSDTLLMDRLSKYGKPELLREVASISKSTIKEMGHEANDTFLQCWKGNTLCDKKEIQTNSDPVYGNCFIMPTRASSGTVDLILDVQSEEYVHQLTSSAGFTVSLGDSYESIPEQQVIVFPGMHSIIRINKLTSIKRLGSSCNISTISKKACEIGCFKSNIVKTCGCSLYGEEENTKQCEMNQLSDYVCVKSLKHLHLEGQLPCQCQERCSEKKLDVQMTMAEWPSTQYMEQNGKSMTSALENASSEYRSNIAKLTIQLTPELYEEIEEYESKNIMDLLVRIGGLSALVAGISAVTVLEIVYLMVQCLMKCVRYVRRSSDGVASPRRLSDSEITSITWAMYRQRRRFEEIRNMKERPVNNTGLNALGGNVHSRVIKRNSYATPEHKEANGDLVNKHTANTNGMPARHYYIRRYDGNNFSNQPRNRDSASKDWDHHFDKRSEDAQKHGHNVDDYRVNVISPHHQVKYTYDNRHMPVYTGNVLQPNGFQYMDKNVAERHRQDNVFFYDGAAAYFNPSYVSEPVYL